VKTQKAKEGEEGRNRGGERKRKRRQGFGGGEKVGGKFNTLSPEFKNKRNRCSWTKADMRILDSLSKELISHSV
jgi:hypothetical protein